MARVFLSNETYNAATSGAQVFGAAGTEQVNVFSGTTGVSVASSVERVDLSGNIADYTFSSFGAAMTIRDSAGNIVATVSDSGGKSVVFADGALSAAYAGTTLSLGGVALTGTAAAITPAAAAIDATTTSDAPASTGGTTGGTGQTFTLTTGIDTRTGTSNDDTFIGSFDGAATSTSNLGDQIDGGDGTDTVRIVSNAAATIVPTLTNVENLHLLDNVHETRDVTSIAGLNSLELDAGTATAATAADTVITLGAGQSLILDSITDASGAAADVADQEGIDITTAASITSLDLGLDGVGAAGNADLDLTLTSATLATLNVTSTGANVVSMTAGGLTTLNVGGSGSTVFTAAPAGLTTVNAATASGALTLDLQAGTANTTITGGTAGDTITANLANNITVAGGAGNDIVTLANATAANLVSAIGSADAISGGDGIDTLALIAAGAVSIAGDSAADRGVITGFEQLRVTDDLNNSTFDISQYGINYLQVGADITNAAATVNGFTSGATVEFRDANATAATQFGLIVGMTGATGAGTNDDTLNLVLNDDLVNQATAGAADGESIQIEVGVQGINKLNVSTADRSNTDGATSRDDGYTLTLANDNNVDTITATGSNELAFTSTASTAALQTVDASALTGDLIVNLATNGLTQGVVVTGGAGANTITGTGFADQLTGGARADVITGGDGTDQMTGGGGNDTFAFATGDNAGADGAAVADVITDFLVGSDNLQFTGVADVVSVQQAAVQTAVSALAAGATEAQIATAMANANTTDLGVSFAVFEGNTYAYFETTGATATHVEADNILVELTGVTTLPTFAADVVA